MNKSKVCPKCGDEGQFITSGNETFCLCGHLMDRDIYEHAVGFAQTGKMDGKIVWKPKMAGPGK